MVKPSAAQRLDAVQELVGRVLKPLAFRKHGRTFTRTADGDLAQVINFQAGQFPVGGWREILPWRRNLYGKFTVNLGVFVPEVYAAALQRSPPAHIHDYDCAIRARLGELDTPASDRWWDLGDDAGPAAAEVVAVLERVGLPFLEHFRSRDAIRRDWVAFAATHSLSASARVDVAIVAAHQGDREVAAALLREQRQANTNPKHAEYLSELADRLRLAL